VSAVKQYSELTSLERLSGRELSDEEKIAPPLDDGKRFRGVSGVDSGLMRPSLRADSVLV